MGLHAHPRYLKAHGTPYTLEQLRDHPLIGFDKQPPQLSLPKLPLPITRDIFSFRCENEVGQYAALRAGFGIGACEVALAKRDRKFPPQTPSLQGAIRIDNAAPRQADRPTI